MIALRPVNGVRSELSNVRGSLSEVEGYRGGLPAKAMGDSVNGEACLTECDGCCDTIRMRRYPSDVHSKKMIWVGICVDADLAYGFRDVCVSQPPDG
jgi:hypothetical protein